MDNQHIERLADDLIPNRIYIDHNPDSLDQIVFKRKIPRIFMFILFLMIGALSIAGFYYSLIYSLMGDSRGFLFLIWIYLLVPPKYDPVIKWKEWLERNK